ncbi:MAG: type II toxin-antitoxin system RelE/ParE family toxin [Pseudomonadota bacterium]
MKHYRVILTPNAMSDIEEAWAWLHDQNPVVAKQWRDGLRDKILDLATLPERHAIAPESAAFDTEIRQMFFGRGIPWRVFYCIGDDQVTILHIRHARREDWQP